MCDQVLFNLKTKHTGAQPQTPNAVCQTQAQITDEERREQFTLPAQSSPAHIADHWMP